MQKIQKSISKRLPPLKLYEDELRELYSFLATQSKEPIVIETCGYRLDTLDELKDFPETQTNSLFVSCREPYVQVRLTETHGEIYIGDGDVKAEGIAIRIEDIVLRGKVYSPSLDKAWWLGYFVPAPFGIGLFLKDILITVLGALLVLVFILWLVWNYQFKTRHYNTIIFRLRKNSPGFWHRNRDQILMLVIGSLIGALVTWLFSVITR